MLAVDRYRYILNYLGEKKSVTRKELASLLYVTVMTIGRDLKKLEEKGFLICTYGGAILPNSLIEEKKYDRKKEENREIKKEIAKEAFEYIHSNMTIILDAGTTTYELARLLVQSSYKNIQIITNDLYIALELYRKEHIRVLLLGGEIIAETGATATMFSMEQMQNYNADIAFLGISSISQNFDLTVPTEVKSLFKRTMMKISEKSILLVDKSKFNKKKLYKVENLKAFTKVITDYSFSQKEIEEYSLEKKIVSLKQGEKRRSLCKNM